MPKKSDKPPATTTRKDGATRRQVTFYPPDELYKALGHYGVDHDLPMSEVVLLAVREFLQRHR